MAVEVLMPRLGWTMETGQFVEWVKKDGETVKSGDILFTVETDKALNEVECLEDGLLRVPPSAPQPGSVVSVGALLGYILAPGEAAPFEAARLSAPAATDPPAEANLAPPIPAAQPRRGGQEHEVAVSPRARRAAAELGIDVNQLTGSGRTGRIVDRGA